MVFSSKRKLGDNKIGYFHKYMKVWQIMKWQNITAVYTRVNSENPVKSEALSLAEQSIMYNMKKMLATIQFIAA